MTFIRWYPWGVEVHESHSWLWLGHSEAEGLSGTFWVAERRLAQVALEVQPGGARDDRLRTVELTLKNETGLQTARQQFDQATTLLFDRSPTRTQ